jgi:hypothetical protein
MLAVRIPRCPDTALCSLSGIRRSQTQSWVRRPEFVVVQILSSHIRGFVGFVVQKLSECVHILQVLDWCGGCYFVVEHDGLHTVSSNRNHN